MTGYTLEDLSLIESLSEVEIALLIEEIFPTAKHCENFWVGRRVIRRGSKEELGEVEIFEWQVERFSTPSLDQLKIIAYLSPEKIDSVRRGSLTFKADALIRLADKFASNPLKWAPLSEEDREEIISYRGALERIVNSPKACMEVMLPEKPKALRE